jgi:hypothetical protein
VIVASVTPVRSPVDAPFTVDGELPDEAVFDPVEEQAAKIVSAAMDNAITGYRRVE